MKHIAVLGSGGWGTALAAHLALAGHDVRLWGRNAKLVEEIKARRVNSTYLPDVVLPASVALTPSLEEALTQAEFVVAALPSHGTRAVIRAAAPFVPRQALIVSAVKGLEQETLLRISEVIAQEIRGARPIAVLSGPSFALEVARGLPTAICVACADPVLAEEVQREFRAAYFRLYRPLFQVLSAGAIGRRYRAVCSVGLRVAIRQAITISAAPASVAVVTCSPNHSQPNSAAQMNAVYSSGSSACASARA